MIVQNESSSDDWIVCLHGLGDSNQSFLELTSSDNFKHCNLYCPNLPGFGLNSHLWKPELNQSWFEEAADFLFEKFNELGIDRLHLVGHSLGGDLATTIAELSPDSVRSLVNIEGSLTKQDLFYSGKAVNSSCFSEWFKNVFPVSIISESSEHLDIMFRYLGSLHLANERAFHAAALELVESYSTQTPSFGQRYLDLNLRKLFIHGSTLSDSSKDFINSNGLLSCRIDSSTHWPMISDPKETYALLDDFFRNRY